MDVRARASDRWDEIGASAPGDPRSQATVAVGPWTRPLADVLSALDDAGVWHCVLRLPGADPGPRHEVDLLVESRDLALFRRVVMGLGFVPLAAWGHGGHRFYAAYREDSGSWLKLDVLTTLRYGGRSRPLGSKVLDECLARRWRADQTWVPDVADGLLGLLLHCLLDKRAFKDEHGFELLRLRALVHADQALEKIVTQRFEAALGPALPWLQASEAIGMENWTRLLERRRRIAWELFHREPLRCARRWLADRLVRLARPLLVASRGRGLSIALLGPDGAGKTSLARALAEDPQIRARIAYMGSNPASSTVALPTTRWIGSRQRNGNDPAGQSGLMGGIRYGNRLADQAYRSLVARVWGLRGRFVVFDRHPYENQIAEPAERRGARLRRRLLQLACVRPQLILLLDVPPTILRARKSDHTLERLTRQRERYRSLPLELRDCLILDTSADQEQTARRAKSLIWSRYRQQVTD